jgi:hypothetical protein
MIHEDDEEYTFYAFWGFFLELLRDCLETVITAACWWKSSDTNISR